MIQPRCFSSYNLFLYAVPYVNSPYRARRVKPIGSPFWVLIARGIDEPASTMEAKRASSSPYCLFVAMR